jgi:hypothetical protein
MTQRPAGAAPVGENVGRLKSELRRHPAAMSALRDMGLGGASVERLHLGLKPAYRAREDGIETKGALCFPVLSDGLRPIGRYAYLNLPGVTENPHDPVGWGPGMPLVYRLGSFAPGAVAVVATDVVDAWRAWQIDRGESPEVAFVSRSQPDGWPAEWMSPEWWARFSRVLLLPGRGDADFLREVAPRIGGGLSRVRLPAPLASMADAARATSRRPLSGLLADAEAWSQEVPARAEDVADHCIGRFAATPVQVTGAWFGGHLHHPFVVESRSMERSGRGAAGRVVHAWETMVLRSDGLLLTAHDLPAPRGAQAAERVMALSDGTRILAPPVAARAGGWSLGSIEDFVAWRVGGGPPPFRPLGELLADVEAFIRSRVALPVDGHHLLAALYVALSHVHQVFDAIPLLLIAGPRGTGKSELGDAIARIGYNATVASQLRAAGMIRLLDETRGLLVLDDMDGDGPASIIGTGELAQALKTSYKKATSRKPLADRGGRVRMVDFYGPKVVSTTRGVDDVLGSRMLAIVTGTAPTGTVRSSLDWTDVRVDEVRDELHCWAMASAVEVAAAGAARAASGVDRRAEIEAPVLVLADLAGPRLGERLRKVLRDPRTTPDSRCSGGVSRRGAGMRAGS